MIIRGNVVAVVSPTKFIFCVFFMCVATFCSTLTAAFIHDKLPIAAPLPDIWFYFVEEHLELIPATEFCISGSCLIALLVALSQPNRAVIISRFCVISGMLYLGRCITMMVTLLPLSTPNYSCAKQNPSTDMSLILRRAFGTFISAGSELTGLRTACGDWIYSGHTLMTVLASLFTAEYAPKQTKPWLPIVCKVISLLAMIGLVTTRIHYTIDVILAYYITTRLFWSYHDSIPLLHNGELSRRGDLLTKIFWLPLLQFVES